MQGKRLEKKPDKMADIVGLPDDWDKKNLTTLINNFKKDTFTSEEVFGEPGITKKHMTGQQWITLSLYQARQNHQSDSKHGENGMKIEDTEMRIALAIPYILWNGIEAAYPLMFRDREHNNWFIKHFGEFKVAKHF